MKLCMICAWLVAMLLFSGPALAELVPYGYTSGSASAAASQGHEYDPDGDSSDCGYYTTVAGEFWYKYTVDLDIEGFANPSGGWARSTALTYAHAGPLEYSLEHDTGATTTYEPYDPDPIDRYTEWEHAHFDAYTGVSASWRVAAVCEIEEGSDGTTWASGYASAEAYME